jgi:hypothetical protein
MKKVRHHMGSLQIMGKMMISGFRFSGQDEFITSLCAPIVDP